MLFPWLKTTDKSEHYLERSCCCLKAERSPATGDSGSVRTFPTPAPQYLVPWSDSLTYTSSLTCRFCSYLKGRGELQFILLSHLLTRIGIAEISSKYFVEYIKETEKLNIFVRNYFISRKIFCRLICVLFSVRSFSG